jgi:SAM-dependent methyltransferase
MGLVGGPLAYWFLKRYWPGGKGIPMGSGDPYCAKGLNKLETQLGPAIFDELRGKVVLDFGCGEGHNALELAQNGCARVIGLDIQEHYLEKARIRAQALGVQDRCTFTSCWSEPVDAIVSTDAFEHFAEPEKILHLMRGLLKPSGCLLVAFGPLWYHPYGGHLFSVFPWAHLIFTESALIRWRSDFKSDGARRFHEVAGGLNGMTIRRWERLVAGSGFKCTSYELVPIRPAKRLHCRLTREWLTSLIRARLIPR